LNLRLEARRRWRDALSSLSDDHPVWIAVREFLEEMQQDASTAVAQPRMDESERAWQCGYLAGAQDALMFLDDLRNVETEDADVKMDANKGK
jgi:hypothetical protein